MATSRFRRSYGAWALLVLGSLCLAAGSVAFVLNRNFFDARVFGQRAEESLSDAGVAAYASELVANAAIRGNPDLIAVRPVILSAANSVVTSRPFRAVVGKAAQRAHEAMFSERGRRVVLSLPDLHVLLRSVLEQASPQLAAKILKPVEAPVGVLGGSRISDIVLELWRAGRKLRWASRMLLVVGFPLILLALWLARRRRHGLVHCGVALILVGLVLAAVVPAGRIAVAIMVDQPLERGLIQGLWKTYLADLGRWGLLFAGLGVLCAAGATSLLEAVDPGEKLRHFSRFLVAPPPQGVWRPLWALALLAIGVAAVAFPGEILSAAVVLIGICAAYSGIRELFRLFLEKVSRVTVTEEAPEDRRWLLGAGLVVAAVLVLAAGWVVWRNPTAKPLVSTVSACNGSGELCDRRVDEVVFAGAHNAMSNQQNPRWMFPQHEADIPHQLGDGIRALLVDVHYGFPAAVHIKTDMSGDPMGEKVKQVIGKEGYDAALRIRNTLAGADEGRRGLYLCHGVCELGAYELEPVLGQIREFLLTHPDEVILIIVEDYVEPRELAAAFERSGLADFVYREKPEPRWPKLRDLIASRQQVVVFIESGRGGVEWLRPAFQNFRETPYSFHKKEDFSCRPNRGGDAGSLFLVNHWIDTAPTPKPSNAEIVNAYDYLLSRARQCASERKHLPNIVAVDFYRTGHLMRVVDKLNGVRETVTVPQAK